MSGKSQIEDGLILNRWMGSMAKVSPIQFFRQVKQEVKKVTWPTKKEVVQTSIMVLVIVAIAAAFFFVVDQILGWGVQKIFMIGE